MKNKIVVLAAVVTLVAVCGGVAVSQQEPSTRPFDQMNTQLQARMDRLETNQKFILQKLDTVIANQQKILGELDVVKIRATRR